MRYVIVDLEATCWEQQTRPERMEIIEIGAVLLESSGESVGREFAAFVKPVASPKLSDFCTQLTSIRQEDVDGAEPFSMVFWQFLDWIGDGPFYLCSWGAYDLAQLRIDCRRHAIAFPASFENHINLKKEFSRLKRVKLLGMKVALTLMGLLLEGMHHRGKDDARNIARLAAYILPQLEAERQRRVE